MIGFRRNIVLGAAAATCLSCSAFGARGGPDGAPSSAATAVGSAAEVPPERPRDTSDGPASPAARVLASATGEATYYADMFEGRRTASGIVFSNDEMFAAHREYPFGTVVRVTELAGGRAVTLRVVDRLPPARTAAARRTIIDVSQRAARALGFMRAGRVRVRVEVVEWGRSR